MKDESTSKDEQKREKMSLEDTILGNSSSMLGFCFVVISYLNASSLCHKTIVDELTMLAMVAFMANCVLSFLSMRKERLYMVTRTTPYNRVGGSVRIN